ncbi:MAG TPA: hypothetical protein VJK03_02655 [Candidatus Nanoarchaeia archaeon]|nr:hypothetical protein [Candidatus Nanoarchaeia archaeon]
MEELYEEDAEVDELWQGLHSATPDHYEDDEPNQGVFYSDFE